MQTKCRELPARQINLLLVCQIASKGNASRMHSGNFIPAHEAIPVSWACLSNPAGHRHEQHLQRHPVRDHGSFRLHHFQQHEHGHEISDRLHIIMMIPNIVSGIYGMDIPLPFQEDVHAFSIVSAITGGVCALAWLLFLKKCWL
jgi:hypothetical protein